MTGLTAGTAYEVRVQATNAEGTSAWSAAATATTTAAPNEAPTFSTPAAFSVAENTTAAGTVTATDADADDSVTGYTITGGADQAKFSIDTNTGALTFNTAPNFEAPADADTDNAYIVEVTATSGTSSRELTATQAITVTVTDVGGEAPSAPSAPTISAVTATGFTVTWTEPANTGPAITGYTVQYRETGGSWADTGHQRDGSDPDVDGPDRGDGLRSASASNERRRHERLVGDGHRDNHGGTERGTDVQQPGRVQRGGKHDGGRHGDGHGRGR